MKKHFSTDEIDIEMEIGKRGVLVHAKLLDEKVFPIIDVEDSEKMARFSHQLANQLMGLFSTRAYHVMEKVDIDAPTVKEGELLDCPKCSHPMEPKKPCCGQTIGTATCVNCGWRIPIKWGS